MAESPNDYRKRRMYAAAQDKLSVSWDALGVCDLVPEDSGAKYYSFFAIHCMLAIVIAIV